MKLVKRIGKKSAPLAVACTLAFSLAYVAPASAGDTWPFVNESAHGHNQTSVHGYTSGQIANWSPETDPDAELLRSRVPLQQRIEPFAATQANPSLSPDVQMITVAGDYGNAFIENAAYTNKFAQYHFNFWQYIDYYSYWHGTATAYTPPEYYDALAQADWQQKWFEFGMLNIPNPTYTDAAHKNGVLSLAGVFFSNNDRGQQTYKQMIVQDEDGNYPVAEKMIEMAAYFGFDGYFINQEEVSPNVTVADIPAYIGFMKALQKGGLYVQWYDSLNTATGANSFARTFNDNNFSFMYDKATNEQVSQSFFFDYGVNSIHINNANTYLANYNQANGTSFSIYDIGFAGLEAGRDRFKNINGTALANKLANGLPRLSLATLGADFVHAGLDEDMGLPYPSNRRADNDYQWMTTLREQLWWSGPNVDPKNAALPGTNTVADVYADNRYWPGIASVIAERSVISSTNFYTSFNTGHGLSYYKNGAVSNTAEWSNMSLQDIPVTWQWWQDTAGSRLAVDFDYGPLYNIAATERYGYEQLGGYEGGSSLVVNGTLDAENFLRLYKMDLDVNAASKLSVTYNKPSADDDSSLAIGVIFADNPAEVVKVPVAGTGARTAGWQTQQLDLGAYAGKTIAALGLVFAPGQASIANYQMNIGQLRIFDGSAAKPAAPTGLEITQAFTDTKEMNLAWNLDEDYSRVKQYNVYVNDVFVGGKYDEVFYIKQLPAMSGTIKVAAVGADGLEGDPAILAFDLESAVSNIQVDSRQDGMFEVTWDNAPATAGEVTVQVKSVNWITTEEPVAEQLTVPAGATSATFANMPVNGDDYLVTIQAGNGTAVSQSGNFIDTIAEPYAEAWSWNGTRLNLPMPNTRDWRYMYVLEDGVQRSFPVTYFSGAAANRDRIIRGRTTKASLSFVSTARNVSIVMEDYAGNRSEPLMVKETGISFEAAGSQAVAPGGEFAVQYGLQWNTEVTAQDITISFDPDVLAFEAAESLDESKFIVVGTDEETPGEVRLLATHLGAGQADPNGKLLKLVFKADAEAADGSTAAITAVAKVSSGTGTETTHPAKTLNISIQAGAVDKTALDNRIVQAQQAHGAAVEGNRVGNYPVGSKAILQAAIDKAAAVAANGAATAAQVAAAEAELAQALQAFQAAVITSVPGDYNNDNQLSVGDLGIMAKAYGKTAADADWDSVKRSDLNDDGKIDIEDLVLLAKLILKW